MITILAGTNRPGSNTRKVAGHVQSIYREMEIDASLLDLADLPMELFEGSSYAEKPESFQRDFVEPLLQSDGWVVVIPEYNGGFPGVLKYFIDMLPFPESLDGRPACFIGLSAGQWGAMRPIEQLQQIFAYRNAYLYPERVFLPGIHTVIEGDRIADSDLVERLKRQAGGFASFARSVAG